MEVVLKGSGPGATTAGIMLLTRARQLGLPLQVSVIADPNGHAPILGPAALYAPVLASCGVGREHGHGAFVVLPGAPKEPLLATATPHGVGGWFRVTRTGEGCHPATQAYVRLSHDPRVPARRLAKDVRRIMDVLGMSPDPAVLDVLFGADVQPLTRLSLALRAGRALAGGRGEPVTRFLSGKADMTKDPLPAEYDREDFVARAEAGEYDWIFDGFSPLLHDAAEAWGEAALRLAKEDDGRDVELVYRILEIVSHLVQLPPHSILPPLGAAEDSIAVGIGAGLAAEGHGDANQQLSGMFQFLGGRYVEHAEHAFDVVDEPIPPAEDRLGRLQWFCRQVRQGRKDSDGLWPLITDPPQ